MNRIKLKILHSFDLGKRADNHRLKGNKVWVDPIIKTGPAGPIMVHRIMSDKEYITPGSIDYDTDLSKSAVDGYTVIDYHVGVYDSERGREFSTEEKDMLRPIAEVLAMLDGNAFFGSKLSDGREWYEQYLPEAWSLFIANGGINGASGHTSWIQDYTSDNPARQEAAKALATIRRLATP